MSSIKSALLAVIMTGVALMASEEGLKPALLDKNNVGLVATTMLKLHFKEHKMTPGLARKVLVQAIDNLDPVKMFYTQADIDTIMAYSDEDAQRIGDAFLAGNFSAIHDMVKNFNEKVSRDAEFFDKLQDHSDRILEIAAKKPNPKLANTWSMTEKDRLDLILARIAVSYNFSSGYLTPEDAMKMALNWAKKVYIKAAKPRTESDNLTLFMKSYSNALDPHTSYFEPSDSGLKHLDSSFAGVGIGLKPCPNGALVEKVYEGSPAGKSGKVEKGDQIVEINGVSLAGQDLGEIVNRVRGEVGTELAMKILKKSGEKIEVKMTRATITAASTQVKVRVVKTPEGNVGVLAVDSFYEGMSKDVKARLEDLKKEGIIGLVLDLRNNGGGYLGEAVELFGLFVPSGPVVATWDGRNDPRWYVIKAHPVTFDGPMVVLVNQYSASASELTAGALQDLGRAIVVGPTRTFGKGSVQGGSILLSLFLPGKIMITSQLYFLPRGGSVQLNGVTPDISVLGVKLSEEELESKYDNVIPNTTIKGAVTDKDENVAKWTKWKSDNLSELAKSSVKRISSNKEYLAEFSGESPKTEPDYQADEAAAIAGESSKTWK